MAVVRMLVRTHKPPIQLIQVFMMALNQPHDHESTLSQIFIIPTDFNNLNSPRWDKYSLKWVPKSHHQLVSLHWLVIISDNCWHNWH